MDEPATENAWDHFDNTWLADFIGLSLTAAIEKAEAEGRPARVLRPWSDMTLDFRPDRLNLRVDAAGDLIEMSAG
ncbi:I78 family peptidase inhibitor [Kineococcus sp. R86509]|uniref:I78 family peptidase inhibitor n=1 Tax=Kineococcus sp. R86509 TaxID=3093851 RepID=UPI0036D3D622